MGKVSLFIAVSVDGFIADEAGQVTWISGQRKDQEILDTYQAYMADVATIIMGNKTYQQVTTTLSPDKWPYTGYKTYVLTHKAKQNLSEITFSARSPAELVKELKETQTGKIWICGGASIAQALQKADLIDEYYLTVIPVILGKGIRLFSDSGLPTNLNLSQTTTYNGIVELKYEKR